MTHHGSIRSGRRYLLCATAIPLLLLGACADGVGFDIGAGGGQSPSGPSGPSGPTGPSSPSGPAGPSGPGGPTGPSGPSSPSGPAGPAGPSGPTGPNGPSGPSGPSGPTGPTSSSSGSVIGASVGNIPLVGPTGPGSLVGVNLLPGSDAATGSAATVELLTGDGTVAQLALPTTADGVQQGLAPVGALAGTLLGAPAGGAVTQLTDGLSPTVATVTSAVDQVATPLLATVNGALGGTLIGATVGGNALTGPSTAGTLAGVNLLPGDGAAATGQLATATILSQGTLADVALPTTAAGVEAGLQPVGTLVGGVLGPQAGNAVDQVGSAAAPVVAAVTGTVSSVTAPLLDTVNSLAPALTAPGGGDGSSPLAPVTGGATAPVTGLLGGLLGRGN